MENLDLITINEKLQEAGLAPLTVDMDLYEEALGALNPDDSLAQTNESDIMGEQETQGETGNSIGDTIGIDHQAAESADGTAKYFKDEQLKTEPSTAYFWSGNSNGVGGKDYAMEYAAKNGGTTLEDLMKRQGINMPTWSINDPDAMKAWDYASALYDSQASGEVRALIGATMRQNSVWQRIELKTLMENPNVSKIIVIDPETLNESVIFRR